MGQTAATRHRRELDAQARRRTDMKDLFLGGVFAVVLAACGGGAATPATPPPSVAAAPSTAAPVLAGFDAAELEAARDRWAAADLPTYRYLFEDDCGECQPATQRVVVWDGAAASAEATPSVDEMFSAIEEAIAAGTDVDVVYDADLGFPLEVWIDREARAYDGGTHWLLSGFAAGVPGDAASIEAVDAAVARWEAARPLAYEFRTTILCGCEIDGWLWTRVEGDRIVDWDVHLARDDQGGSLTPITIDEMLEDLRELFVSGVEDEGVRIAGTAEYDPALGHPVWIGLDIEVLDPAGELGYLPPRLVFSVSEFTEVEPSSEGDFGTDLTDLYAARERWQAAGLLDYEFALVVHDVVAADYGEPHTVTVVDGAVFAVSVGGVKANPADVPAYSIDELFELIEVWTQSGDEVEALYDETAGYPVVVVRRSGEAPLVLSISDLRGR